MNPHNDPAFQARWQAMPLAMQLGNIGAELRRALVFEQGGMLQQRDRALDRGLDLASLTLRKGSPGRLRELCRLHECLGAWRMGQWLDGASLAAYCEAYGRLARG
jgi:hypothetical protein